jgi:hypothetical protein
MAAVFKTTILDRALRQERRDNERKRRETIRHIMQLLPKLADKYGFDSAFLFGSVAKPGRFHERSDMDIAVFGLSDEKYFAFMGELSQQLRRDVDVIQMEKHYLKDRIREPKSVWKKSA